MLDLKSTLFLTDLGKTEAENRKKKLDFKSRSILTSLNIREKTVGELLERSYVDNKEALALLESLVRSGFISLEKPQRAIHTPPAGKPSIEAPDQATVAHGRHIQGGAREEKPENAGESAISLSPPIRVPDGITEQGGVHTTPQTATPRSIVEEAFPDLSESKPHTLGNLLPPNVVHPSTHDHIPTAPSVSSTTPSSKLLPDTVSEVQAENMEDSVESIMTISDSMPIPAADDVVGHGEYLSVNDLAGGDSIDVVGDDSGSDIARVGKLRPVLNFFLPGISRSEVPESVPPSSKVAATEADNPTSGETVKATAGESRAPLVRVKSANPPRTKPAISLIHPAVDPAKSQPRGGFLSSATNHRFLSTFDNKIQDGNAQQATRMRKKTSGLRVVSVHDSKALTIARHAVVSEAIFVFCDYCIDYLGDESGSFIEQFERCRTIAELQSVVNEIAGALKPLENDKRHALFATVTKANETISP